MKKLIILVKKMIMALIFLYSINMIINKFGWSFPVNYVSIAIVTFLGVPGLLALLVLMLI